MTMDDYREKLWNLVNFDDDRLMSRYLFVLFCSESCNICGPGVFFLRLY